MKKLKVKSNSFGDGKKIFFKTDGEFTLSDKPSLLEGYSFGADLENSGLFSLESSRGSFVIDYKAPTWSSKSGSYNDGTYRAAYNGYNVGPNTVAITEDLWSAPEELFGEDWYLRVVEFEDFYIIPYIILSGFGDDPNRFGFAKVPKDNLMGGYEVSFVMESSFDRVFGSTSHASESLGGMVSSYYVNETGECRLEYINAYTEERHTFPIPETNLVPFEGSNRLVYEIKDRHLLIMPSYEETVFRGAIYRLNEDNTLTFITLITVFTEEDEPGVLWGFDPGFNYKRTENTFYIEDVYRVDSMSPRHNRVTAIDTENFTVLWRRYFTEYGWPNDFTGGVFSNGNFVSLMYIHYETTTDFIVLECDRNTGENLRSWVIPGDGYYINKAETLAAVDSEDNVYIRSYGEVIKLNTSTGDVSFLDVGAAHGGWDMDPFMPFYSDARGNMYAIGYNGDIFVITKDLVSYRFALGDYSIDSFSSIISIASDGNIYYVKDAMGLSRAVFSEV